MQMPTPVRAPTWFSRRRLFEQKLSDLHKCTDLNQLKQMHAVIYKSNLHQDPFVAPKLIAAFSLCRQMALTVNVFSQIQEPNLHLYNSMIRAHVQNSQPSKAFAIFLEMQKSGVRPDNFTYPFLLKACAGQSSVKVVEMIHAHIEKHGFFSDIFVPNSLIDTYSKCGSLGVNEAQKLFETMSRRDVVSWNSMIGGLANVSKLTEARKMFDEMPERDTVSWNTIIDGYVKAGEMNMAFDLFENMPVRNVVSWSTMVSGYSKAGDMEMAKMVFDKMPVKNLVAWTIIISGYAEKGLSKEAIDLYNLMEESGLTLDDGTIVSILAACAESGLLGLGKKVYNSILRRGYRCSTRVNNALIDMFAKCGSLNKASIIFKRMEQRDLVTWNAMIHGLAMHGRGRKALKLFSKMKGDGFSPDQVTFVGVLCACTHAGLVDEGIDYFYAMERNYGVVPEIEHYGCMLDLLGRGGHLNETVRLVQSMPFEPNAKIWGALLGACRMHNAVGLAKEVLNNLVKLEPIDSGNFNMLSYIYAAAGDWNSVANVRLRMKNKRGQKPSGASSIELDGESHDFTAMDTVHPQSDSIYDMVDQWSQHLKQQGYAPNMFLVNDMA